MIATVIDEVGVMEATGHNDGARIDEYQASTGAPKFSPYCGSGGHWAYRQCGKVLEPAREFALAARWAREHVVFRKGNLDMYWTGATGHELQRISIDGDSYTLFYPHLGRVGHKGFIIGEDDERVKVLDFNTNAAGAREGQGVMIKWRDKELLWTVNRWWE